MHLTPIPVAALCAGLALAPLAGAAAQHDHDHGEPATADAAVPVPLERGGPPSRERFGDWAERDGEGRWFLWSEDLRMGGPDALRGWVPFLIAERDALLLERLVLTRGSFEAADALWKIGAPGAMRSTAWLLSVRDSRTRRSARAALEQRATAFLGWEAAHRATTAEEVRELAAELRAARADDAPAPLASERHAPPMTDAELFGALAGARGCEPFGNRLRADEGVVYDQAVLRAVETAQAHPDGGGPEVHAALLGAARSDQDLVARLSMLAFTHMTPSLVPVRELGALAEDPGITDALQDVALLSASYGAWPAASIYLHRHGFGDPRDSTWRTAWGRLVERGDAYTLVRAEREPVGSTAASAGFDPASFRADRLRTLEERLEARRSAAAADGRGVLVQQASEWLERLALATLWDDPQRAELEEWTFGVLGSPDDELRPHLAELGRSYASELEPGDPAARAVIEDFVRQWARDLAAQ